MAIESFKGVKAGATGVGSIFRPFTLKFSAGRISFGPAKDSGGGVPAKGNSARASVGRSYAAVVRRSKAAEAVEATAGEATRGDRPPDAVVPGSEAAAKAPTVVPPSFPTRAGHTSVHAPHVAAAEEGPAG